jgi:hypothetical protein
MHVKYSIKKYTIVNIEVDNAAFFALNIAIHGKIER